MRFTALLLAALLLALGFANALPLRRDVVYGAEEINVAEATTATGEQFTTTLHRVEANANGAITRDVRIALVVDVSTDGVVTLNGEAVPVGRSTHKVPATLVPSDAPVDVTVNIDVKVEDRETPFGFGRVYLLHEHITELDGERVFETGMRQWTLTLQKDGVVTKYATAAARFDNGVPVRIPVDGVEGSYPAPGRPNDDNKPHHGWGKQEHDGDEATQTGDDAVSDPMPPTDQDDYPAPPPHGRCAWYRRAMRHLRAFLHVVHEQFDRLPLFLRLVISFCLGAFSGYVLLKTLICISGGGCCKGSCKASDKYDVNLQVYALQYTALPEDEKEKKEKEAGIVV